MSEIQSTEEIEESYLTPDPWHYKTNSADKIRKKKILDCLKGRRFHRAVDIGAGEGWITTDLPADTIYGYEISDNAAKRFPSNVRRTLKLTDKYDLILASGILYPQHDGEKLLEMIEKHASGVMLFCNIKGWEVKGLEKYPVVEEFPYHPYEGEEFNYIEVIRMYDKTTA